MKSSLIPLIALSACLVVPLHGADSKRTAEYVLANFADHEGKEVTLDVAFVKPVHWKSPNPEFAFFRAFTMDRLDDKPGGAILVAIPAEDASKFSKKYGMDFEGRKEFNTLRGVFLAAPARKGKHPRVWIVDTTGKISELLKGQQFELPADAEEGGPGEGGPRPPRR